jgi:hypothetical protein
VDHIGSDERLEIVIAEASRALDQQHSFLDSLRGRSTPLTTGAALLAVLIARAVLH